MIVIDIGCARYGGDYSIERLQEEFKPEAIYGFDPNDALDPYMDNAGYELDGTKVFLEKAAAWTFEGEIGYLSDGLNSSLTNREDVPKVHCFDLAVFIENLLEAWPGREIVLKMDAEGSEYELLEHLMKTGTDKHLKLAWIEWHGSDTRRRHIEEHFACPVVEWRW